MRGFHCFSARLWRRCCQGGLGLLLDFMAAVDKVSILIVDDVNSMRVVTQELLVRCGFKKIQTAANGAQAQELLAGGGIDLVLSDWHMSPVGGMELLQHCRQDPALQNICFIMVTAENIKESVVMAIKSGVDDYLCKPLTVEQITTKVFKVLTKKKVIR